MRKHSTQQLSPFGSSYKTIRNFVIVTILFTTTFSSQLYSQSCPNVDFSAGNFSSWIGRTGTCCPINLPTIGIVPGRHTIIAGPGVDANTCGGLVLPAPGFTQVARLGNPINGAEAEGLSYSLVVDPTNALFVYTYAVVLEDPGHTVVEQPRFELQVRDAFNNIIPCTFYEVSAGAGIPGFNTCGGVVWKDWTQAGVDLTAYMGQTVTIEARTGDCSLGGHYGYGYIAGQCMPLSINLGFCSGAATANLSAPAGFAHYLWSTGDTTQNIVINNPAVNSVVTCTITSVTGCQAVLSTTLIPTIVTPTITSSTNVTCFAGNNGTATVNTVGGTAPYTYAWAPSGGTAATATGLAAGTYTVTVTETSNNCTGTATVTISQPSAANSITATTSNVLCNGGNTGSIDITPVGGTPTYTYAWSNGSSTEDVSGLATGTYSVIATDINGCTASFSQNISQPATAVSINGTVNPALCWGASSGGIDITPAGGTPGYSFDWTNGTHAEDLTFAPSASYTVTATDLNGCTATYTNIITQPTQIIVSGTPTPVSCFGGNTGTIDITPIGGTPGYTYYWNTSEITQDVSGYPAANYSVVVTDANGCTTSFSTTITQPLAALTVTGTSNNIQCFGANNGSIVITPTGGVPAYSYLWSTGATSQNISGLSAGSYTLDITDANGCTNSTFTATIIQPAAPLSINGTLSNVSCFGGNNGSIDITPTGGTPGYSFDWTNGTHAEDLTFAPSASYTVTATDLNGCTATYTNIITQPTQIIVSGTPTPVSCFGNNTGSIDITTIGGTPGYTYYWNTSEITQDVSGYPAANYSVVVTDANLCSASFSTTITEPAAALTVTGVSNNILCFGGNTGTIDITPTGGTINYTYLWSNGSTTEDLTTLAPGSYSVLITDANGCTNGSYAVNISQPASALSVTGTNTNILCFGATTGSIDVTTTGGTPGYSYLWTNGSTTEDMIGLPSGFYGLTVTDASGCTNNVYAALLSQPAAAISVNGISNSILCHGNNTGSVDITITGGTPTYTYVWSNGGTSEDISGLVAGVYNVMVTDASGCTNNSYSTNIMQPNAALIVNGNTTNPLCHSNANGAIDASTSGGVLPYNYIWSTGSPEEDLNGLIGGTYSVIVTDANGCTTNGSWILTDPLQVTLNPVIEQNKCYGVFNAFIDLGISGGTVPYSILWNNGATANHLDHLHPGDYSVNVTDLHGCTATGSYTIEATPIIYVNLDSIHTIWLGESIELDANASGGSGTLTYTWSPPDDLTCTDCEITNASPTINSNYAVTVTDENGCTAVAGVHIELMFAIYVPNTFTPNGDGNNDSFSAVSGSVKKFTMRIFDRWGEEVFTTSNINDGWDGDYKGGEAKQDVYVFRIEATFVNGKYEEMVGQVNLLR